MISIQRRVFCGCDIPEDEEGGEVLSVGGMAAFFFGNRKRGG